MKNILFAGAAALMISACSAPNQVQTSPSDWKVGAGIEGQIPGGKFARETEAVTVEQTFPGDRSQWGDVLFEVINVQKGRYYFAFNNTYLDKPLTFSSFCAKQGDQATRYFLGMERDAAGANAASTADFRLVVKKVAQHIEECTQLPQL